MQSDEFITFYFNKRTGDIKQYCTGVQDMSIYGNEQQDFELIYGFIVVDRDVETNKVMRSRGEYIINLTTREIEWKMVSKFKVQQSTEEV